ncbi:hypothetical protein Tsubulata_035204 [Turnera subulata]|uniref:Uncharacterized protein n=1 Tax=Turnera subulata TaxID=218843 RepID=A0A9Q0J1P6_9ROSI|nr:hypothetical protein Tsubulata_035204 [Turnera subulata]
MASRYRSLSKPTISILKSTINKPGLKPRAAPSPFSAPSSLTFSRPFPQLGALQSLLPLHSAVSSARLTSCLGIDSRSSRSLSQGMLCSANPGNLGSVCRDNKFKTEEGLSNGSDTVTTYCW